jgi:regulator of sirC expression with transglutaminase-like and TPR domain
MTGEKEKNKLNALIRLLDEPDEKVYKTIRQQILALGTSALPILEEAENHLSPELTVSRLSEIIHAIRVNGVYARLKNWSGTQTHDLLEAWLLLSGYLSPDEDPNRLKETVTKLYRDIWVEMNSDLTALEKIRVVNHVFYRVYQYDALQGKKAVLPPYLLGNVLRMQRGNPLSLAMLYLIVVQRLKMPVFGVNLPRHLILAYTNGSALPVPASSYKEKDVLFYVNPFNKGAVFRKSEIELYLKQLNLSPQESYFVPCDNKTIIKRWLHETALLLQKSPQPERAADLEIFMKALT